MGVNPFLCIDIVIVWHSGIEIQMSSKILSVFINSLFLLLQEEKPYFTYTYNHGKR